MKSQTPKRDSRSWQYDFFAYQSLPSNRLQSQSVIRHPSATLKRTIQGLRSKTAAISWVPTPPSTRNNPSQRQRVSMSFPKKGSLGDTTISRKILFASAEQPKNDSE